MFHCGVSWHPGGFGLKRNSNSIDASVLVTPRRLYSHSVLACRLHRSFSQHVHVDGDAAAADDDQIAAAASAASQVDANDDDI